MMHSVEPPAAYPLRIKSDVRMIDVWGKIYGKIADIGPPHVGLHNWMFPDETDTWSLMGF